MSLHPQPICPVPEETARVARAAFPRGNRYLRIRDELGTLFEDEDFASLFPRRGKPATSPWRLALITVMPYAEGLSDRQAANAVRGRIDWKYALGLELTDPGVDSSVLSEFRSRLVQGSGEAVVLDRLLARCREKKLLSARGRQRTDSTHVVGKIRGLNRVECVGEALRHALNALAVAAPAWLRANAPPEWAERYGPRMEDAHLPQAAAKRRTLAERIGEDGHALLDAVGAADASRWLRFLPAVDTLRRIWIQQFLVDADGRVRWRTKAEGIPPTALFISSPYDVETRYAKKRTTSWIGYKVHLTESCDAGRPHLITNVETTPAPLQDAAVVDRTHDELKRRDLLPDVHRVDTGYVNGKTLVESGEEHGVRLVGPIRRDARWQAREKTGFATSDFRIDWDREQAICPAGRTSSSWSDAVDARGHPVVKIKFSTRDCAACPHRESCTRSTLPRRTVTVRPRAQHEAIEAARMRQESPAFEAEYAKRAGIEGTVSAAVRAFGLRRARYVGLAKTHLQHVLTATALNLTRVGAWLAGDRPAVTRTPRFVAVLTPAGAA